MHPFRSPNSPPLHLQLALWVARRVLRRDLGLSAAGAPGATGSPGGPAYAWRFYRRARTSQGGAP